MATYDDVLNALRYNGNPVPWFSMNDDEDTQKGIRLTAKTNKEPYLFVQPLGWNIRESSLYRQAQYADQLIFTGGFLPSVVHVNPYATSLQTIFEFLLKLHTKVDESHRGTSFIEFDLQQASIKTPVYDKKAQGVSFRVAHRLSFTINSESVNDF